MPEVSNDTRLITRATCAASIDAIVKERGPEHGKKFAEGVANLTRVGQLGLYKGRKLLILDPLHAADLSVSPAEVEAADEAETDSGLIVEVDTTNLLLATERTLQERVGAMVEFGKVYSRKHGVAKNLPAILTAAKEEAFEGFSEDASLNDVIVFYVNKLDYTEEDLSFLTFAQKMGMMDFQFNVQELTAVEVRQ